MKKLIRSCLLLILSLFMVLTCCGCHLKFSGDGQAENPDYHEAESGTPCTFLLQLRQPGQDTVVEENDAFPHSTIDGELIYEWEIPMYGNTVYESVTKYFEGRTDSITFRLSQHTFYMFHDCTLPDGTRYDLETVYIAADGVYANCANYQSVLGSDGIAGTEDDLKILTLVYKGWLY